MSQDNYQKTSEPKQRHRLAKEDFKAYLEYKQFTSKSIARRLVVFDQYLKWIDQEHLDLEQISYNDLLLFMKHCQHKGITQRTIMHYIVTVRHFYDHLEREQMISINPATDIHVKGVKRKALYHTLEPHELHTLYNHYPAELISDRRNKVMLGLLVYQGLQTSELGKLEVKDVNLREGKIYVPGSVKSVSRDMTLEAHQIMDMYDYVLHVRNQIATLPAKRKSQEQQQTDQLFIGDGGNCYSVSNFVTKIMIKVRQQNQSVLNANQIRTSVIVKWLKMHNLRQVQYLAGHKYISSTESYLQNDLEGLSEEIQQFHPLG